MDGRPLPQGTGDGLSMPDISRRDFLTASGASATGAVFFAGCAVPERELLIQSPNQLPEDSPNSFENWYASTCRGCAAGCGIIVRVVEGRAKKIEGNPDHPVNRGKLCARGLAGVQELYHPDRIRTPLRREGARGSGRYQVITWEDAVQEVADRLKDQGAQGGANQVVLATEPMAGLGANLVQRFVSSYGADYFAYNPMDDTVLRAASRRVFGSDRLPVFDIARSNYILSFGAHFLGPWLSEVQYNRQYGEFRQGRQGQRGYLVQIEPRMSGTAANADEWIPINPGTEGVLAMSIASVLVSENLASSAAASAIGGAAALSGFRPDEASRITGVPAQKITELARAFARGRPGLAIGGAVPAAHTNGLFNLTAIYTLNYLVDSVGKPGGVQVSPLIGADDFRTVLPASPFGGWRALAERMRERQPRPVNLFMVHNVNPVYGLPNALQFGAGLKNVPVIVSFSSFLDETAAMADLILPDHNYLEAWGDHVPEPAASQERTNGAFETLSLQQPVVRQMYDTRAFLDVLLDIGRRIGGPVREALPWDSYREGPLRASLTKLSGLGRGSVQSADFDRFYTGVLQRGGWWDSQQRPEAPAAPPALLRPASGGPQPEFAGAREDFPFHLTIFPSQGVGDGSGAHLPWLQMVPDPTTTVMWQSWVEINPTTARDMGLETNDIVVVESPAGRLEAIVYVYPGIAPNVVAMPAGQGHSYMGRYAERRGANPFSILAPQQDTETGALAWNATRVRLRKTGRRYNLPRLEGGVSASQPEDYSVVQVTRGGSH